VKPSLNDWLPLVIAPFQPNAATAHSPALSMIPSVEIVVLTPLGNEDQPLWSNGLEVSVPLNSKIHKRSVYIVPFESLAVTVLGSFVPATL
jgi:hypothetical protein